MDYWNRVCAIRALREAPTDIFFPELLAIAEENFKTWERLMREGGANTDPKHAAFNRDLHYFLHGTLDSGNFLQEILRFADVQQSSRTQFFHILEHTATPVARDFLNEALWYFMSAEMQSILEQYLIALFETQPQLLNLSSVNTLRRSNISETQVWLNQHFDQIVELCLQVDPENVSNLPYNWFELRSTLTEKNPPLHKP